MLNQIKIKFALSGTGAQQKQIRLPRMRIDSLQLRVKYTVTDAGISAGENFEGCVDKIKLGEGSNLPLYVERDELSKWVGQREQGINTGHYVDTTPTTATEIEAYYNLRGPFQLRGMANPVLDIALRAITDEFGGATVFTGTVTVLAIISKGDDQKKSGFYWHREYRSADTRHELNLGPSLVNKIFVQLGSSAMTKVQLSAASPEGGRASTSIMDVDIDEPQMLLNEYAVHKTATVTAGAYLIQGIRSNVYPDRRLLIDTASATCLMFSQNLVM